MCISIFDNDVIILTTLSHSIMLRCSCSTLNRFTFAAQGGAHVMQGEVLIPERWVAPVYLSRIVWLLIPEWVLPNLELYHAHALLRRGTGWSWNLSIQCFIEWYYAHAFVTELSAILCRGILNKNVKKHLRFFFTQCSYSLMIPILIVWLVCCCSRSTWGDRRRKKNHAMKRDYAWYYDYLWNLVNLIFLLWTWTWIEVPEHGKCVCNFMWHANLTFCLGEIV